MQKTAFRIVKGGLSCRKIRSFVCQKAIFHDSKRCRLPTRNTAATAPMAPEDTPTCLRRAVRLYTLSLLPQTVLPQIIDKKSK